jgi:hypothetical protein
VLEIVVSTVGLAIVGAAIALVWRDVLSDPPDDPGTWALFAAFNLGAGVSVWSCVKGLL